MFVLNGQPSSKMADSLSHPYHYTFQQNQHAYPNQNQHHDFYLDQLNSNRSPGNQDEQTDYILPSLPPIYPENTIHIRISSHDMLPVPENFSMIANGIYRSSFPRPESFEFLKKLKLKSML